MMTPHRAIYHKPAIHIPAERAPLIVALGVAAWLLFYAVGFAVRALILAVGGGA